VLHGKVDGLDKEGQRGQRSVLLRHTHKRCRTFWKFYSCLHKWVWPFCGLWAWCGRTSRLARRPRMSNPLTSHGVHDRRFWMMRRSIDCSTPAPGSSAAKQHCNNSIKPRIWHSQAAEGTIAHFCKQERKRPTPVRRRLSRIHPVFVRRVGTNVGDENTESRSALQLLGDARASCPTLLRGIWAWTKRGFVVVVRDTRRNFLSGGLKFWEKYFALTKVQATLFTITFMLYLYFLCWFKCVQPPE